MQTISDRKIVIYTQSNGKKNKNAVLTHKLINFTDIIDYHSHMLHIDNFDCSFTVVTLTQF